MTEEADSVVGTLMRYWTPISALVSAGSVALAAWALPSSIRKLRGEVTGLSTRLDESGRRTEALIRELDQAWHASLKKAVPIAVSIESAESIIRIGLTRNLHQLQSEYESSVLPHTNVQPPAAPDRTDIEHRLWSVFAGVAESTRLFFRDFEVMSRNIGDEFNFVAPIERTAEGASRSASYRLVIEEIIKITLNGKDKEERRRSVGRLIEAANDRTMKAVLERLRCSRENCGARPLRRATGSGK